MSREERRNYERMMKNMERGPALPPAARARAERKATKRARRAESTPAGAFTRRFWVRTLLIAVAIGFVAFSLQWSNGMPVAAYVGLAAGLVVLALLVGFRFLQRRGSSAA
jgi:Flp pilus assembly protein TadB